MVTTAPRLEPTVNVQHPINAAAPISEVEYQQQKT